MRTFEETGSVDGREAAAAIHCHRLESYIAKSKEYYMRFKIRYLILVVALILSSNARAECEKSESYDSFTIDVHDQSQISVILSASVSDCGGSVEFRGLMRAIGESQADSGEQIFLADYILSGSYVTCPVQSQRIVKSHPIKVRLTKRIEDVKVLVPAGYSVELSPQ